MSTMIRNAVAVVAIALTTSVTTANNRSSSNLQSFKSAQYCMPDYDVPGAKSDVYC
jgi:hypothetical protein